MIKKIVFSFLFFIAISIYSQQEKINDYKYIIVPEKFEFLKNLDQYQTSSLTKFLLEKKGFIVYLSNETFPKDLLQNRCLAITANVMDESSMFTVKSKIQLKDCFGNILYTSQIGKSKEKDYKKSYHEAIRNAYNSMEELAYKYAPKTEVIQTEVALPVKKVIPVKITPEVKVVTPLEKVISKEITVPSSNIETLYAQAKATGFQLVNTTPAIIFYALKTNVKDVFIIKDKNGIMYKNGSTWLAEYYENDRLVVKQYNIKF